jgi:hypothetical protein
VTCGTPTAGDDAGGADGARTDADLDRVGARVDERLGALAGRDVAADDLHVRVAGSFFSGGPCRAASDVAVGGVGDEHVDAGVDQRGGPLPGVAEVADGGTDQQAAVGVLGGVGELLGLHEVLDRDQAGEPTGLVDQRQPLALVLAQQRGRVSREMPAAPVMSGIGVITSSTLVVAHSRRG